MSIPNIRPSSIEGIKRLAKAISKEDEISHSRALDRASQAGGFSNYQHARRSIAPHDTKTEVSGYVIFASTHWRDPRTRAFGRETVRLTISKPLDELVKPTLYKYTHKLGRFRRFASDHVVDDYLPETADEALTRACGAARVLQFIDATGLQPSKARIEPRGDYRNRLPGRDHGTSWYDPTNKQHILADEPYGFGASTEVERRAWASRNNWAIVKPRWRGMYFPEGGSELYLATDLAKGPPLDRFVEALEKAAPPIDPERCDRISSDAVKHFATPGERADAAAKASKAVTGKDSAPRGPNNSVGYHMILGGRQRRPKGAMPVEMHAEVGRLLKGVLVGTERQLRVYKPIDSVRCRLDDWVQCEYDRQKMPDSVFFDLYYHESRQPERSREAYVGDLQTVKAILSNYYPDCAPLRNLFKQIDGAIGRLSSGV